MVTTDFEGFIRRRIAAHHAELERACERALQGGVCGVRVVSYDQIEVHPDVPYGHIYHYPQGLPDD